MHDCTFVFGGAFGGSIENATIHRMVNYYSSGTTGAPVTNSLLISVTNHLNFVGGSDVITNLDDTGYFQTVGAGMHYLASASPYRGAGTTNIDSILLSSLATRTTYPPIILTNALTLDTTLPQQAQRESFIPDIGYAYDPIDWLVGGMVVSNASLTLGSGTTVATYGTAGISLKANSSLSSQGSAEKLNILTRYNMAQEDITTNWCGSVSSCQLLSTGEGDTTAVRLRFVRMTLAGGTGYYIDSGDVGNIFTAQNCELYGGCFRWESGSLFGIHKLPYSSRRLQH